MWNRAMIKGYAKQELKYSYWLSFAVCLVAGILTGSAGGASGGYNAQQSQSASDSGSIDPAFLAIFAGVGLFVALIVFAYSFFVALPIEVGKASFFVRAPYGDRRFGNLFSSFSGGRYFSSIKTMFVTNLFIFLWSLLFIVPGIIKSYQYRMVPYIISENPSLTPKQARDLSSQMTDGEKWEMFVLDLSFIGWVLLGCLALGVGVLFVAPYVEATWAQLYFVLRQKVMGPPKDAPSAPVGPEIV